MQGHSRFFELLDEARDLHIKKNAGYAGKENPDPLANFRRAEIYGIPAFFSALIRLGDKIIRCENLCLDPDNEMLGESLIDTMKDAAAYYYLAICLYEEDRERNDYFLQRLRKLREDMEEFDEEREQ